MAVLTGSAWYHIEKSNKRKSRIGYKKRNFFDTSNQPIRLCAESMYVSSPKVHYITSSVFSQSGRCQGQLIKQGRWRLYDPLIYLFYSLSISLLLFFDFSIMSLRIETEELSRWVYPHQRATVFLYLYSHYRATAKVNGYWRTFLPPPFTSLLSATFSVLFICYFLYLCELKINDLSRSGKYFFRRGCIVRTQIGEAYAWNRKRGDDMKTSSASRKLMSNISKKISIEI
jgi:hypothetical protein